MSDEQARIFGRERRNLGLTVADYLRYLAQESDQTPAEVLQEVVPEEYSILQVVYWDALENADLFDGADQMEFQSFTSGDAHTTLVQAQQLIRELEQADDPDEELRPLILELAGYGASRTLIAFEG